MPDLPTLAEEGLKGYDVSVFFGIVAPKGTPVPIVAKLNAAFKHAMQDPEIKKTLAAQGIVEANDQTPEGLVSFIDTEVPKWAALVKSANISLD